MNHNADLIGELGTEADKRTSRPLVAFLHRGTSVKIKILIFNGTGVSMGKMDLKGV